MEKFNEKDGIWRTVGGRRIFIRTGQSLSEAMKASGKFKTVKNEIVTNKAKKSNDEKSQKQDVSKKQTFGPSYESLTDCIEDFSYGLDKTSDVGGSDFKVFDESFRSYLESNFDKNVLEAYNSIVEENKNRRLIDFIIDLKHDGLKTDRGIERGLQREVEQFLKEASWLEDLETNVEDYENYEDYKTAVDEEFELLMKEGTADESDREYVMRTLNNIGNDYKKGSQIKNSKEDRDKELKRRVDALVENGTTNKQGAEAMLKTRLGMSEKDLDDLTTKGKEYEKKQSNNKNEYTKQELKDKYGTDDVDLINAGKEKNERVSLKQEEKVTRNGVEYNVVEKREAGSFEGTGANRRSFHEETPERYKIENPNDKSDWSWIDKNEYESLKNNASKANNQASVNSQQSDIEKASGLKVKEAFETDLFGNGKEDRFVLEDGRYVSHTKESLGSKDDSWSVTKFEKGSLNSETFKSYDEMLNYLSGKGDGDEPKYTYKQVRSVWSTEDPDKILSYLTPAERKELDEVSPHMYNRNPQAKAFEKLTEKATARFIKENSPDYVNNADKPRTFEDLENEKWKMRGKYVNLIRDKESDGMNYFDADSLPESRMYERASGGADYDFKKNLKKIQKDFSKRREEGAQVNAPDPKTVKQVVERAKNEKADKKNFVENRKRDIEEVTGLKVLEAYESGLLNDRDRSSYILESGRHLQCYYKNSLKREGSWTMSWGNSDGYYERDFDNYEEMLQTLNSESQSFKKNDWVRKAFNQYKSEHPKTKKTLLDFMKK